MKKIFIMVLVAILVGTIFSGCAIAGVQSSPGPAPSSGDGVSDGSGWDSQGLYGHPSEDNSKKGPAPNAGDGIPDGSGF